MKNVNFDNDDNDKSEGVDEDDGGKGGDEGKGVIMKRALYEVEFSDGEIWDGLGGDEIHSDDEEL